MEESTAVSVLTADDTRSKASSRSRRGYNRNNGKAGPPAHGSVATTGTGGTATGLEDNEKAAADGAARLAIQIADAAIAKYLPRMKTASQVHTTLYRTNMGISFQ